MSEALLFTANTGRTIVLFIQCNGKDKQTVLVNSKYMKANNFYALLSNNTVSGRVL